MGRLLSIDYGRKRCGIAVTDPLGIVAGGVATIPTHTLETWLRDYLAKEQVSTIVVGLPRTMAGTDSESMKWIKPAVNRLSKLFPQVGIEMYDERFTSVLAHRAMLDSGIGRERRRDKALVDTIAATIILNDYLQSISNR